MSATNGSPIDDAENIHVHVAPLKTRIKSISFCYLNARSILSRSSDGLQRFDHLHNFVCLDNSFDVILITETHLENSIDSIEINIEGFQLFRKDRNRSGGGVAIYVRNELGPVEVNELKRPGSESIYVKILNCDIPCIIGVFYRPPNQSSVNKDITLESLRSQFDFLSMRSKLPFFLFGDFNDRCVCWNFEHLASELGHALFDLVEEYNFVQVIDTPTRENNLLDLLITNCTDYIANFKVIDPFDNLDHNIIIGLLKAKYSSQLQYKRTVRHFTSERLETLNRRLQDIDWHALLTTDMTADQCAESFTTVLTTQLDLAIPKEIIIIRPNEKPGMTKYVRKLFNRSHTLCRRASQTGNNTDKIKFCLARRKAKKAWFEARQKNSAKLYAKATGPGGRSKAFWKILKQNFGNNKNQSIPTLVDGLNSYTSDASKACILNAYFVEQSTLELTNEPDLPDFMPQRDLKTDASIEEIFINPVQVFAVLKSLDANKATGPDGIGNTILKSCASALCLPISILSQISLNSGSFPKIWKKANVVPIYKKGEKNCKSNYRPISLLSNVSKVLEKLVYNVLYEHCAKNKLLSSKNSGFKKGDGAVNQMISLTDIIYKALDNGKNVVMVFLDIQRAFDRVWHKGLLHKLQCLGVGGVLLKWLADYMSNRSQKVVLSGQESPTLYTNSGVPQGSILAPLLFLIFMNDIDESIVSDMFIFADDTTLNKTYTSSSEAELCINDDLKTIATWANKWFVTFNLEKTVFINFSLKKQLMNAPKIEFNALAVKQVSEHKHLGIIFSEDMKWTKHIKYITSKANQRLGALYRQSLKMTRVQIETLYCSSIRPILEYGCVLFDNCSVRDSKLIEAVQRRAAVLSTGAIRRTETAKLMAETGWDSLKIRRTRAKMACFYQIVKGTSPPYLSKSISFKPPQMRSSRALTRNSVQIIEPQCRINCYQKSFFPDCIKIWNLLTNEVVNSTSINVFKINLLMLPAFAHSKRSLDALQYSNVANGHNGRLITQFRLGLSPLRNDLFTYNITDNPFCASCGQSLETLNHFLFECLKYSQHRLTLMNELSLLILYANDLFHLNIDINSQIVVRNLIINGIVLPTLDDNFCINSAIFKIVSTFISSTARFNQSWPT